MKPTAQIDKNQWQCWLSTLIFGNKTVRETQDWQPSITKADARVRGTNTPDLQGVVIHIRHSSKRQPHYIQTQILQIYRQKTDTALTLAALCLLVLVCLELSLLQNDSNTDAISQIGIEAGYWWAQTPIGSRLCRTRCNNFTLQLSVLIDFQTSLYGWPSPLALMGVRPESTC